MAVTRHTLTGDVGNHAGGAITVTNEPVIVLIEANVDEIRDTAGNVVQVGKLAPTVASNGTWSASLIASNSADIVPASGLQYQVIVTYPDPLGRLDAYGEPAYRRERWESGWFDLTAAADLADLPTSSVATQRRIEGTGSPEGVVTASVGATYVDTAKTNGAREWFKDSGTGNTGWIVKLGDTGWRNVASLLTDFENGTIRLRRVNERVYAALDGPQLKAASASGTWSSDKTVMTLPAGFLAAGSYPLGGINVQGGGPSAWGFISSFGGPSSFLVRVPGSSQNWLTGHALYGVIEWPTDAAWPSSLPGVAYP